MAESVQCKATGFFRVGPCVGPPGHLEEHAVTLVVPEIQSENQAT
ncbi:hypothetical protein [Paenarthrobacter histidinolovorans]|uniref:Uncharacterized protein n=1 Tax=Paenarthrobacter histidinolovorans TaxID=43664 RepID=A0ABW8NBW9_9MICC|nr:hypothetical protein [Paenarthrobacter histidinolovorans]